MFEDVPTVAGAIPPPATLVQMISGYWVSQAVYVAAKLGVADLLADGPRPVEELAAATQTDAPSLHRVLRALASLGVFTQASPGTFALTPLAALLQTGTPDCMRALAIMHGEEPYRAWGNILHSVQIGQTAFAQQFGTSYFAYLAQHPEANRVFNQAMTGNTTQLVGAVVEAYDFSPFKTIVDVGGSYGTLLAAILRSNPAARGILFDQPHVAAAAQEQVALAGMAERCTTVGGDFFVEVPAGAREATGDRARAAARGGAVLRQMGGSAHAGAIGRT
jgi:O-methyltransferase domain/Dimerisation domain